MLFPNRGTESRPAGHRRLDSAITPTKSRYAIRGGILTRHPGGAIRLSQTGGDEPELRAAVTGFVPRLHGALYEQIQRRLHVAISRRYFERVIDEERP